jgi:hypothetical protein
MKRLIPWLLLCSLAGACAAPPAAPTRMSPSAPPAATQTPMNASSPTAATGLPNSIEQIASDMSDPHEALLSGVPAAFDRHRDLHMIEAVNVAHAGIIANVLRR